MPEQSISADHVEPPAVVPVPLAVCDSLASLTAWAKQAVAEYDGTVAAFAVPPERLADLPPTLEGRPVVSNFVGVYYVLTAACDLRVGDVVFAGTGRNLLAACPEEIEPGAEYVVTSVRSGQGDDLDIRTEPRSPVSAWHPYDALVVRRSADGDDQHA